MSGPKLYTPATGVQDREAFRALLARLGIDAQIATDADGQPTIALDAVAMQQLAAWFAEHGDAAQAEAIRRALAS
ncbi:hypothetical protein [Streptomyces sp. NPDC091215]|uniref:hypothetical protein n=1 Tax=Streptomyces sp. NPDC091215 TaxID=3155192 RepID=UPI0034186ECA